MSWYDEHEPAGPGFLAEALGKKQARQPLREALKGPVMGPRLRGLEFSVYLFLSGSRVYI